MANTKTIRIEIDKVKFLVEFSGIEKGGPIWEADIDIYSVAGLPESLNCFTRDFLNDIKVEIRLHESKDRYGEAECQAEAKGDETRGN